MSSRVAPGLIGFERVAFLRMLRFRGTTSIIIGISLDEKENKRIIKMVKIGVRRFVS